MPLLLKSELRRLVEHQNGPCVSIFASMVEAGAETRQNRIRFKNLIARAEEQLIARGIKPPEARQLLEPGYRRLQDDMYWRHQRSGLAFFLSRSLSQEQHLPARFDEVAMVADKFYVTPLLPLLVGDGRFYILALSRNQVRLFEADRHHIAEVHLQDMPQSLAEALQLDKPEKSLQWHTEAGAAGTGIRPAVFHGHGTVEEDHKDNLLRYFRRIDRTLHPALRESGVPLVLAGVEYCLPIYREANTYPWLLDAIVEGNPDGHRKSPQQLQQEAWEIVAPHFRRAQQEAIELYRQASGTPRASKRLTEILPAAFAGRVMILFVTLNSPSWGRFDPRTEVVEAHPSPQPGDEDLFNLAAMQAYLHGGAVYALRREEMPCDSPLSAVFRY